jgi:hypothetical protein
MVPGIGHTGDTDDEQPSPRAGEETAEQPGGVLGYGGSLLAGDGVSNGQLHVGFLGHDGANGLVSVRISQWIFGRWFGWWSQVFGCFRFRRLFFSRLGGWLRCSVLDDLKLTLGAFLADSLE